MNLERKVKILEIKIDNEKTKKAVSKITETEYFKKLREDLQNVRLGGLRGFGNEDREKPC